MKRILITGANKGIGFATVKNLLQYYKETFVLMGSRDLKKGEEAFDSLVSKKPEWKNRLYLVQLDVESEKSVSDAEDAFAIGSKTANITASNTWDTDTTTIHDDISAYPPVASRLVTLSENTGACPRGYCVQFLENV